MLTKSTHDGSFTLLRGSYDGLTLTYSRTMLGYLRTTVSVTMAQYYDKLPSKSSDHVDKSTHDGSFPLLRGSYDGLTFTYSRTTLRYLGTTVSVTMTQYYDKLLSRSSNYADKERSRWHLRVT
jgi:hypothetical protein